jgi:hypothetical protein
MKILALVLIIIAFLVGYHLGYRHAYGPTPGSGLVNKLKP